MYPEPPSDMEKVTVPLDEVTDATEATPPNPLEFSSICTTSPTLKFCPPEFWRTVKDVIDPMSFGALKALENNVFSLSKIYSPVINVPDTSEIDSTLTSLLLTKNFLNDSTRAVA